MAISFTTQSTPQVISGTDATSYASASWTPPNELIILFVFSGQSSGTAQTPTVSGNGITWTQIATQVLATGNIPTMRVTLFGANGSGATSGATTADFAGTTQLGVRMFFISASGTDVSNGVSQTFVQKPTNTATNSTSISVTLSAASGADNRPVAGFANDSNDQITPRTNWTENSQNTSASGFDQRAETQSRSSAFETTASASASSATDDWIGIAAEIKAGVVSNIKTYNTNTRANIKTINTNLIANVKTLDTNTNT